MKVNLLYHSPIWLSMLAARKCTDTQGESSNEKDIALLESIIGRDHTSVIEHVNYTFDIPELSRACLQEMARHRIASPSVQSTRFTLKKLIGRATTIDDLRAILRSSGNEKIDTLNLVHLNTLRQIMIREGLKNDVAKYALPEAFKTTMIWTINARSLRNFLKLRLAKGVLAEIRELAGAVCAEIPLDHRVLFPEIFLRSKGKES